MRIGLRCRIFLSIKKGGSCRKVEKKGFLTVNFRVAVYNLLVNKVEHSADKETDFSHKLMRRVKRNCEDWP